MTRTAAAAIVEIGEIGRAERNKRDKRERLIRAARELFMRKGFAATTTGEIAELADVAKGTLFFHAKSKEALLVMMFQEEVGAAIRRAFSNVPDAPLIEQLMHVFGIMLRQNQRDLGLARIFVKEMAFVRGDRHGVDVVMDDLFVRLGDLIERAKERGEVARTVDSTVFAYNLFALYFVFLVLWLGSGAPSPQRQHPSLRQIVELQLGVVSASAAKPRSAGKRQK
jgi:AcrR family transcriptional regulator